MQHSSAKSLILGTLGSAATFAGEATAKVRDYYRIEGDVVYFPSVGELWEALDAGKVDGIVIGIERTGQPHDGSVFVKGDYFVCGQVVLPIACNLYVRPGTQKSAIRKVVGHGSVLQCVDYLDANFPGISREMHGLNSVAAARDVVAGDGSLAVVGTRTLPLEVAGLETFAERIDSGALSSWWLITRSLSLVEDATVFVAKGRFSQDGKLGEAISRITGTGAELESVASFPCDEGVSTYDYLLSFALGEAHSAEIMSTLAKAGLTFAGSLVRKF